MQKDNIYNFNKKNVLIAGAARTGVAAANLLKQLGACTTLTDEKKFNELTEYIGKLPLNTDIKVGEKMSADLLRGKDMVVTSPGIPKDNPLLQTARQRNIPVVSEIEIASSFARAPIIAVTGTNGKTTVSTMIHRILTQGSMDVMLGGNIGTPLSEDILESDKKDFIVAEISSFQLEWIDRFKPFVAVILNITPDHLDRHGSMDEYINCKKRIYSNQTEEDYAVLNLDDPVVASFDEGIKAKKLYFSISKEVETGAFVKDGKIVARVKGKEGTICSTNDIKVKGVHNIGNALAAITASLICISDFSAVRDAVCSFEGIEHRMEFVREIHGIQFINDSKATNVGAVVKSLEGMDSPVILIAGGSDKGNDYRPLKKMTDDKVKILVLTGKERERMKTALGDSKKVIEEEKIENAVKTAYLHAVKGDVVLLSPACASFDMFKNYAERGNSFKRAVNGLRKKPFEIG